MAKAKHYAKARYHQCAVGTKQTVVYMSAHGVAMTTY